MRKHVESDSKGRFAGAELVGVSSTFYTDRDDPRFALALENAENWRDNNLPYVVIDASPEDEQGSWVKDAHLERGAEVIRADLPGIATQRLQGVDYAVRHGSEKAVGHEPEKTLMSNFSHEISDALAAQDILIIGRTAIAEASLPPVQRRTEHMAGWILEQTHQLPPDTLSGGRGFTVAGAKQLSKYPATEPGLNNWIYLYRTPLEARAAGLAVGGIKVDLMHPNEMTTQETGNPTFNKKRYDQFKLQLDYLLSRSDVLPEARPLADAVLAAMEGLTNESSNEEFEEQLTHLEKRLRVFGYSS